jgi:hypothetical protein
MNGSSTVYVVFFAGRKESFNASGRWRGACPLVLMKQIYKCGHDEDGASDENTDRRDPHHGSVFPEEKSLSEYEYL